ncbi:lysylphosphatidylglycerol synthase transmembrane domain-containing protein [Anaerolinea sp.]|uniref:lysylphosphatidylglycerol synthase transmembrane domain-containing protein n=1 Tax=Anaerolinea sp. TaxID=1872519 RepID=UPI002ACEC357|nr:lysylphosphatidylglycerol synthase transmembrane domain-containing protein [Anaerolinea sp.]
MNTSTQRSDSIFSWFFQWGIGILLTGGAIFILSRIIDLNEFIVVFRSLPLKTLLMVWGIYLVSMVIRAWGWQNLLQRRVGLWRAVLLMNEGYFLNNVLPFRLGEFGRAYLAGKYGKSGTFSAFSTVVVERAYDLAFASFLLLSSLPFAFQMRWAQNAAIALLGVIVAGLVGLYFAAHHREKIEQKIIHLASGSVFVQRWVYPTVHGMLDGFSVLTRFEFFIFSLLGIGFSWFLAIFRDFFVLRALDPSIPFWVTLLAISSSNLGGALPSMAASLGTFEGAATGALSLIGLKPELGLVYALVIHIVHLVSTTIIGGIGISQEGKTIQQLITEIRNSQRSAMNANSD